MDFQSVRATRTDQRSILRSSERQHGGRLSLVSGRVRDWTVGEVSDHEDENPGAEIQSRRYKASPV